MTCSHQAESIRPAPGNSFVLLMSRSSCFHVIEEIMKSKKTIVLEIDFPFALLRSSFKKYITLRVKKTRITTGTLMG